MSSPNSGRTGAARDTGSVREEKRTRRPLILLLGLLALIALGLILYFSLRGGGSKTAAAPVATTATPRDTGVATAAPAGAGSSAVGNTPAPGNSPAAVNTPAAADTASVAGGESPEATNPAAVDSAAPTTGAGAPVAMTLDGGLVGGGAVAPTKATGTLAAADTAGTVLFAENSAALTANARAVIASAAKAIKADSPARIYVSGYTDEIAGQPTNLTLSAQRAKAVLTALHADVGPGPTAYATRDHGENDPVASNNTAAGRQQNRRATITTD